MAIPSGLNPSGSGMRSGKREAAPSGAASTEPATTSHASTGVVFRISRDPPSGLRSFGLTFPGRSRIEPCWHTASMRKIQKTDAEWRAELSPEQYRILRQKGTEAPFTGEYDHTFEPGTYHCAAC